MAITEVGCTAHAGATDLGGDANEMVEWGDDGGPRGLRGAYVRDEGEQAACILELLGILDEEGVDAAFVYTFARYDLPHRDDPREDFDLASCGVVKVLEGRHWRDLPGHGVGAEGRVPRARRATTDVESTSADGAYSRSP